MLIRKAHEKTEHGNIKDTLAELQTKYWLINSRKMVTNYVSKCILCKRLDGARSLPTAVIPRLSKLSIHEYRSRLCGSVFGQANIRQGNEFENVQSAYRTLHMCCNESCPP